MIDGFVAANGRHVRRVSGRRRPLDRHAARARSRS